MKNWYKVTGILATVLFLMTFLACSNKELEDGTNTTTAQENESEEQITLDWYINFSWYKTPWGKNAVSKEITEKTGVDINFIVPKGSEAEKFNALINSDSLPDIITLGWWEEQLDEMIAREMVYPLNELADQYVPYFWQVAEPKVVNWYTKEDGNIYCYPNSSYLPSDYEGDSEIASNQTFLVRKDIYEAIGSPDMTTTEGFENAIKEAARLFPEVEGKPLIPIGAHEFTNTGCVSFDLYLQNFLAVPFELDGKYYDRYTDPDYIEWLKMFRRLGAEGYLKQDIFIDQRIQMEEKIARGQYFCMMYQRTDMLDQQLALHHKDSEKIYIAVDGPKNSKKEDHQLPGAGINGWTVTLISKNCKDPDKAMEFLSFLMSQEGQLLTYMGVEGITYDLVDGRPVMKEEVKKLLYENREEYDQRYGADNAYWMLQNNVMQLQWRPELDEPCGQLEEWGYPYSHYLGQYEVRFDTDSNVGKINYNVEKLWSEILPQLLLAETEEEFDSLFNEFIARREEMGYQQVMEESIKKVNVAKEKLGID